jgi:hypothetical protein
MGSHLPPAWVVVAPLSVSGLMLQVTNKTLLVQSVTCDLKLATFSRPTSKGVKLFDVPHPTVFAIHRPQVVWNLFDKTGPMLLSINAFKA